MKFIFLITSLLISAGAFADACQRTISIDLMNQEMTVEYTPVSTGSIKENNLTEEVLGKNEGNKSCAQMMEEQAPNMQYYDYDYKITKLFVPEDSCSARKAIGVLMEELLTDTAQNIVVDLTSSTSETHYIQMDYEKADGSRITGGYTINRKDCSID